ncbi:MAG: hypothetical protein WA709_37180, partial [Stellaceae bacterium]
RQASNSSVRGTSEAARRQAEQRGAFRRSRMYPHPEMAAMAGYLPIEPPERAGATHEWGGR